MKLMEISLESYHILIALIYETSSTEQQSKLPSCLSFQSVEWNLFDVKYYQSEYQASIGIFFQEKNSSVVQANSERSNSLYQTQFNVLAVRLSLCENTNL